MPVLTQCVRGFLTSGVLFCAVLIPAPAWGGSAETSASTEASAAPRDAEVSEPLPAESTKSAALPIATDTTLGPVKSEYLPRYWLVDPRVRPAKPQSDLMKFEVHGEYQLRYLSTSDLRLSNYGFTDYRPTLGQGQRLEHRMRFNPHFSYRENFEVTAQFDLPHGMLLGHAGDHLAGEVEPTAEASPMRFAFRWLYATIRFRSGELKLGQQPARWGSGLLFDSGDERQFFGDPRVGTIVERVSFQGRPFGASSKLELLLATDWVYEDAKARWLNGDRALRSWVGLSFVDESRRRVGLVVVGEKFQPNYRSPDLRSARPTETTATFDLAGETSFPVPGVQAHVVASGESAMVLGTTDIAPEVFAPHRARVQRFGALARLGAVGTRGVGVRSWGKWGIMLEWGYASGDADPSDGVDRRFTANPGRRVGLVLFDEVLRWKSARASAALQDARLGLRPIASAKSLATAGGVSGATYLALQFLYRPLPNLDVRAATLLAQATTDLVDPARLVTTGRSANFDGGISAQRDLGLELDAATELRQPLDNGLGLSIGAEGGVLFPGQALADANGEGIGVQGLIRGRFGFYF